jgi:hypothetical protein
MKTTIRRLATVIAILLAATAGGTSAANAASAICSNNGQRACVRIPTGSHKSWSGSEGFVVSSAGAHNSYYVRFTAVFSPLYAVNIAYLDHIDIDYWVWGNGVACGGAVWIWGDGAGDYKSPYNKYHRADADEHMCWSGYGAYGQWNYTHRTVLPIHQWYRGGQSSKNGIGIGMSTDRVATLAGQYLTDVRSIEFIRP